MYGLSYGINKRNIQLKIMMDAIIKKARLHDEAPT